MLNLLGTHTRSTLSTLYHKLLNDNIPFGAGNEIFGVCDDVMTKRKYLILPKKQKKINVAEGMDNEIACVTNAYTFRKMLHFIDVMCDEEDANLCITINQVRVDFDVFSSQQQYIYLCHTRRVIHIIMMRQLKKLMSSELFQKSFFQFDASVFNIICRLLNTPSLQDLAPMARHFNHIITTLRRFTEINPLFFQFTKKFILCSSSS